MSATRKGWRKHAQNTDGNRHRIATRAPARVAPPGKHMVCGNVPPAGLISTSMAAPSTAQANAKCVIGIRGSNAYVHLPVLSDQDGVGRLGSFFCDFGVPPLCFVKSRTDFGRVRACRRYWVSIQHKMGQAKQEQLCELERARIRLCNSASLASRFACNSIWPETEGVCVGSLIVGRRTASGPARKIGRSF